MIQEERKDKTVVTALGVLFSLFYFVFSLGFWFHTTRNPVIFGKYSLPYFTALCLLSVLSPYAFFATRFMLTERVLRPRTKWLAAVVLALLLFGAWEMALRKGEKPPESIAALHPYLQVQPIPNDPAQNVNRWGFRGEEIEKHKPANTFRIFMLGGSTVRSEETPFEKTHPRIAELKLRARYPSVKIEVQNAGMDWYTSQHSLINFLTKIQDFDPDLIVIYHGINDLYRSFAPQGLSHGPYQEDYSHYYGPLSGMIEAYYSKPHLLNLRIFSCLSGFFRNLWFSDFRKGNRAPIRAPVKEWKSLAAFERNMRNFASTVRSKNISLIMASQPFLYREDLTDKEREAFWVDKRFMEEDGKLPDVKSLVEGMNAFNDKSRQIAADSGVPFLDLERLVPKTLDYLYDDVHYTEKGNRLIGETLAQFIAEQGIVDKGSASQ